jgi:hypothetical protein
VSEASGGSGPEITRRQFLTRSGALAALVALADVPGVLRVAGWSDPAYAQNLDLVREALNGLVAFVLPGDDPYSVAQGERADGPGGIAAGGTEALIRNLDRYLPQPDIGGANNDTLPLSGAIAGLLDVLALAVNPLAIGGPFLSPFARLSFAEKARAFALLEGLDVPDGLLPPPLTKASGNLAFVAGILPGLVAFLASTEQAVYEPAAQSLRARPVSWQLSGFQPFGRMDGWDELKGYFGGRREAD